MQRTGRGQSSARPSRGLRPVEFDRRKYGRHLLIDVAWVHDLPGFIIGAPHTLGFFDIILVTHGTGWFWLDSHRHRVRPGAVFFTTPGQVRYWDTKGLDGITLFFEDLFIKEFLQDDAFLDRLPCFQSHPGRAGLQLTTTAARRLQTRLAAMRRELAHHRRDSVELLRAQLHETLIVLARAYAAAHGVAPQRRTHPVVSRFLALLERDAMHRHRIADYAADLAVTPGHLSVLCAEITGLRAKTLLARILTTRACRMLWFTEDSIARVGAALGFDDPSYFSRFFRRETGQRPAEFRSRRSG